MVDAEIDRVATLAGYLRGLLSYSGYTLLTDVVQGEHLQFQLLCKLPLVCADIALGAYPYHVARVHGPGVP